MKRLLLVVPLVVAMALVGCSKKDDPTSPTPTTGTITGMVTKASDASAIASASVVTNPATSNVSTDATGNFSITGVAAGTYTVTASKSGFNNNSASVSVTAGNTATANIALAETTVTGTGISITSTPSGARIYLQGPSGWVDTTKYTPSTFTGLTPSSYYSCWLFKDGYYEWHSEGWAESYYGTTDIVVTTDQITNVSATLLSRFSQGTNVALASNGGTASASGWASYGGYDATPQEANDGLSPTAIGINSFWGYYADNCWLRIDFPSINAIRTVVLDLSYGGQTYYIEGSADGTTWFTLMPSTYIPNTAKVYALPSPTSVIAIRAVGTSSGAPGGYLWRYIVSELEAWVY